MAPDWNASRATLQRYSRESESAAWQKDGAPVLVLIGLHGLAWGRGLHRVPEDGGPRKVEGDRRTPAGIFQLGTAFGFRARDAVTGLKLPYERIGPATEAVDDPASRFYNRIVKRTDAGTVDWHSSEKMAAIPAYELGIVVNHNRDNVPRMGSCIFIHLWLPASRGTAGCTALHREDLVALLSWLDPERQPVLIQWPAGVAENPPGN